MQGASLEMRRPERLAYVKLGVRDAWPLLSAMCVSRTSAQLSWKSGGFRWGAQLQIKGKPVEPLHLPACWSFQIPLGMMLQSTI